MRKIILFVLLLFLIGCNPVTSSESSSNALLPFPDAGSEMKTPSLCQNLPSFTLNGSRPDTSGYREYAYQYRLEKKADTVLVWTYQTAQMHSGTREWTLDLANLSLRYAERTSNYYDFVVGPNDPRFSSNIQSMLDSLNRYSGETSAEAITKTVRCLESLSQGNNSFS